MLPYQERWNIKAEIEKLKTEMAPRAKTDEEILMCAGLDREEAEVMLARAKALATGCRRLRGLVGGNRWSWVDEHGNLNVSTLHETIYQLAAAEPPRRKPPRNGARRSHQVRSKRARSKRRVEARLARREQRGPVMVDHA